MRIDELRLDDRPFAEPEDDDRVTAWYQFIGEIDDLLDSGEYTWAHETLTGIRETVEHTRRVSEGQRRAIANIAEGQARSWGRRYDGFTWRR